MTQSQSGIAKISHTELMRLRPTVPEIKTKNRIPIYLLLENIRSCQNVGAIFRTADAALVSEIFLTGLTATPPDIRIDKTALGATDVVPWRKFDSSLDVLPFLRREGISVVALERTHQSITYGDFNFSFPTCIVVGNEVDGVKDETLTMCDAAIDIPMRGRAISLNVSTACGVAVFEALRRHVIAGAAKQSL